MEFLEMKKNCNKLETSVDTRLKKELDKLEDCNKEITQNAIQRDNNAKKQNERQIYF